MIECVNEKNNYLSQENIIKREIGQWRPTNQKCNPFVILLKNPITWETCNNVTNLGLFVAEKVRKNDDNILGFFLGSQKILVIPNMSGNIQ